MAGRCPQRWRQRGRNCVAPRRPAAAAFTLLEIMIALALVLLATGIVMSLVPSRVAQAAFVEGGEQLGAVLSMARAEAQRQGTVVQVVARRSADGVTTLIIRPLATDPAPGPDRPAAAESVQPADSVEPAVAVRAELVPLPRGIWLSPLSGLQTAGDSGALTETDSQNAPPQATALGSSNLAPAADLVIAAFLPDGQAIAPAAPVYLRGAGDRAARVAIRRWTGTVVLSNVPATPAGAQPADDASAPGAQPAPSAGEPPRGA